MFQAKGRNSRNELYFVKGGRLRRTGEPENVCGTERSVPKIENGIVAVGRGGDVALETRQKISESRTKAQKTRNETKSVFSWDAISVWG